MKIKIMACTLLLSSLFILFLACKALAHHDYPNAVAMLGASVLTFGCCLMVADFLRPLGDLPSLDFLLTLVNKVTVSMLSVIGFFMLLSAQLYKLAVWLG